MSAALVNVQGVSKRFAREPDWIERALIKMGVGQAPAAVHALDAVSMEIRKGEVLGLVGESGCGKSTLGRIVSGLMPADAGQVKVPLDPVKVQLIFQDAAAALNPRMRVADAITEAAVQHGLVDAAREVTARRALASELLMRVGLSEEMGSRYPHQLSGGQRSRVNIARALAVQPEFLVCDEAVAALDVSIQAQILNLFMQLRKDLGLTYLFISHDLGVVRHVSDRIAVMYLGRIVELGPTAQVYDAPKHPYTKALLAELPRLDRRGRDYEPIRGEIPSPINPPSGCHFHPRCPKAQSLCANQKPELVNDHGRQFACHFPEIV
jgi:peptide/nickel transport system ATP-binding protein